MLGRATETTSDRATWRQSFISFFDAAKILLRTKGKICCDERNKRKGGRERGKEGRRDGGMDGCVSGPGTKSLTRKSIPFPDAMLYSAPSFDKSSREALFPRVLETRIENERDRERQAK